MCTVKYLFLGWLLLQMLLNVHVASKSNDNTGDTTVQDNTNATKSQTNTANDTNQDNAWKGIREKNKEESIDHDDDTEDSSTTRSTGEEPVFYKYCDDIFNDSNMPILIIKEIWKHLNKYLKNLCGTAGLNPQAKITVIGELYCRGSVQGTMNSLMDLFNKKLEKQCQEIHHFHGVYFVF
ncbi:uncharacterized protein LOC108602707 [Drosophila busckii]|uniref:uncharacterized protein LOC108602707 n=1 Tax=Drosophila busckii TaxID=30019 RepID=UPI00083F1ACD|nr:uncharacterized protein LOC108602707 [Drosophila busckii]